MADESEDTLFSKTRSRLARVTEAALGPATDDDPSPQARDETPFTVGREEFREEVDENEIGDFIKEYNRNPLIRVPVQNFASDVTEPGVSVDVSMPDETDIPVVPESDTVPEKLWGRDLDDALEEWLSECYIDGWSFDASFTSLLENTIKDRRGRRGTAVIEHVYDNPEERNRLMALRPIRTETLTAYTREGKRIALRGDDEAGSFDTISVNDRGDPVRDIAPKTPANKTAAISQFDDVFGSQEREEIPFAYGDISFSAYDADTGTIFGRPDSATILNRASALRQKLRHVDQAIANTAFGNILVKVETTDEDVVKNVRDNLDVNVKTRDERDVDPQTVSVTNADAEIMEVEGKVPGIVDQIQQEIEFVLTSMPTPLYRVGFAGDINRDVTAEQGEDYRDLIKRERSRLEDDFRRMLMMKAKDLLLGDPHTDEPITPDVRFHIRPSTSESPLRDEEFDAAEFSSLMSGLATAAGPKGGATAILPKETILETILDMDAEEILSETPTPGDQAPQRPPDNSDIVAAFDEFTDSDTAGTGTGTDTDNPADDTELAEDDDDADDDADPAPFADVPVLPDNLETLTEAWTNRWAEWVGAGRPEIPADERLVDPGVFADLEWNPVLHPRNPKTGQFVQRSFGIPDDAPNFADMNQRDTLEYLDSEGENIDEILDPESSVTVDGVPNDASSVDEIPEDPDSANPDPDIPEEGDEEEPQSVGDTDLTPEEVREQASERLHVSDPDEVEEVTSVNGKPVAVAEMAVDIPGSFDSHNPDRQTLIADSETWTQMSETEREVAIEISDNGRQLAVSDGESAGLETSSADLTDKYLNRSQEAALEATSEEAMTEYARGVFNRSVAKGIERDTALEDAAYSVRGVADELDININGKAVSASLLPDRLRDPDAVTIDTDDLGDEALVELDDGRIGRIESLDPDTEAESTGTTGTGTGTIDVDVDGDSETVPFSEVSEVIKPALDISDPDSDSVADGAGGGSSLDRQTTSVDGFDPEALAGDLDGGDAETRSGYSTVPDAGDISDSTLADARSSYERLLTDARDEEFAEELTSRMAYIGDETNRAFATQILDLGVPIGVGTRTATVLSDSSLETTKQHEFGHNILHAFGHAGVDTTYANDMDYFPSISDDAERKQYMVGKGKFTAVGTGIQASVRNELDAGNIGTGNMQDVKVALQDSQSLETVDERVKALAEEVNRAFARISISSERDSGTSPSERTEQLTIKDGYSSTNAHEVISQVSELMQTGVQTEYDATDRDRLVKNHPGLVGRYLALLEPADAAADKFSGNLPRKDSVTDGTGTETDGRVGAVSDLIPTVDDEIEETWEEKNEDTMTASADAQGLTTEEYRDEIRSNLADMTEGSTVRMRVRTDTLGKIADGEGEFKNQHSDDVDESAGTYNPELRDRIESQKMGTDPSDPASKKPKYGYMSESGTELTDDPTGVIGYGGVAVEFSDDVKERTTFQRDDSLNYAAQDGNVKTIPQPVNDPDERIFRADTTEKLSKTEELDAFSDVTAGVPYYETQIHGELTLEDVSRVYVASSDVERVREDLSEYDIEVIENDSPY